MPLKSSSSLSEPFEVLSFEPPSDASLLGHSVVAYEIPAKGGIGLKSAFAVYVYEAGGRRFYLVKEPYLDPLLRSTVAYAIASLSSWLAPSPVMEIDPIGYLFAELKRGGPNSKKLNAEEVKDAGHFLAREILGYSLLDPLIRDPEIEDISCEGPSRSIKVWHRRFNSKGWLETNICLSQEKLDSIVARLVHRSGRSISTVSPIVDSVLPEGFRLAATWGREVTRLGSRFSIRKQRFEPYTIYELIKSGTVESKSAAFLLMIMVQKSFDVISGITAYE